VKQLNIQIEDNQHEWLRQKAFEKRISMAQLVRDIIANTIEEESKMKEMKAWESAAGHTLRDVLESTYGKAAEDISVDNVDLKWYEDNLDETVLQVRRPPENSSEALITENLAWVDHPTQICVYEAQEWLEDEGAEWLLIAETPQPQIEVINPWSGATVGLTPDDVTEDRLEALAQFMDDEIREQIHAELAPCSPFEFFRAYVERVGAEEAGKIWFS